MVAKNAFALGIDKPDVRHVIHVGLPLTIDGYIQEIGQAGRDGNDAKCILIYSPSDFSANKTVLTHSAKKKHSSASLKQLDALKNIIQSDKCLWKGIEKNFSENLWKSATNAAVSAKKYKEN